MEWLFYLIILEKIGSAFGCAHIMKKKGRSYAGGWWIGMAIGAYGFIIVCNKLDAAELVFIENTPPVTVKTINNGTEKIADKPNLPLQELKEDEWICSNCEHINNIEKKSCYYCGAIKDRMMYM